MANVTKACRAITELTPLAQQACNLFMEKCKASGLEVLITETYRSQERQNYLYEQGRSRPGEIVTWTNNSRHTSRRAWDICQNVKGKEYNDAKFFVKAGQIAASLGITWGGTWTSSPDKPHFEISSSWKVPVQSTKGETEAVEKSMIIINGQEKEVERILVNGTNYIKIRDVAEQLGYNITNKGDIPVLVKK